MNDTPRTGLTGELTRQLHAQVDQWHSAPLTLDDVQGKARTIRRRRTALASGIAAAAILAVIVPVGLALTGPGTNRPAPAPNPTEAVEPTPNPDGTFPLAPLEAPQAAAPATGYIDIADRVLRSRDVEQDLPGDMVQLERFGDGWLGLEAGSYEDTDLGTHLVRFDSDFRVVDDVAASSLVVDEAGQHAAWTEIDGAEWTLVQASPTRELVRTTVGPQTQLVGHLTGDRVVFQTPDYETGNDIHGVVGVDGSVATFDGVVRLLSTTEATSQVAVMTKYGVRETCYAVLDPGSGTRAFETCDFQPRTFSPDGSLVVGFTAGDDGLGSPQLAILDAATGEPLVEWTSERGDRSPALVQQAVWEDDDTVLATVTEGTEQTVVRADLDGSLEQVAEPEQVEMSIAYRLLGAVFNLD